VDPVVNRRAFLGTLAAGLAGIALDPERLLWVPGQKRIFLPSPSPSLVTSTALTKGDVFTIAGVYAINPATGRTLTTLQNFVIIDDVSAGPVAVASVIPRPMDTGPYRNVNQFSGCNRVRPLYVGETIPSTFTWRES